MFLEQARKGKNDLGSYLLGIFLVVIFYFIGQLPITLAMLIPVSTGELDQSVFLEFQESKDFSVFKLGPNLLLFYLLLMYVVAFLGLWLAIKYIHKKPFLSVITARLNMDWGRVGFAFIFWMILGIIGEFVSWYLYPELYSFQGVDRSFFILLIIAIFMLPVQTSFEEIFFRGYLLQGIGLASRSPLVPLLVTSLLFGLVHFMNPEVSEFGLGNMMTYYIGVGIFLGVITILDDGLELALGVHAATNIFGAVFVTYEASALQTQALFKLSEVQVNLMNIVFFIWVVLFILVCRKKYKWPSFKKILTINTRNES